MADKDHITEQATKWFVQLNSGNAKETDFERWQSWREAAPDNETAWQKVEQLTSQFKPAPANDAANAPSRSLQTALVSISGAQ